MALLEIDAMYPRKMEVHGGTVIEWINSRSFSTVVPASIPVVEETVIITELAF